MVSRPSLVLALGGTIETSFVPLRLFELLADYAIEAGVALSAEAESFVSPTALEGLTGRPPYRANAQFAGGVPLHLAWSEAELLVIAPGTARLLVQCATGSITCPVTRLFAFTDKARVVFAPALHPRFDRRIYDPHLERLRELGVTVVEDDAAHADWAGVRRTVLERLAPPRREGTGRTVLLEALRGRNPRADTP